MKKFFCSLIVIISAIILPLFVACNAKGSTTLAGVRFSKEVFEADINHPFRLEYKVYPSTAKNFSVSFAFLTQGSYTFENDIFEILTEDFTECEASIYAGGFSDTCTIRRKEYPNSISFDADVQTLACGFSKTLALKGTINEIESQISDDRYIIELSSDNPSIVMVQSGSLTIYSTGEVGSATITAKLINQSGKYVTDSFGTEISATTRINITESIDRAIITMSGVQKTLDYSLDYTKTDANTYVIADNVNVLDLGIYLISPNNTVINNSDITIQVTSSNASFANVASSGSGYKITLSGTGETRIEIITNLSDSAGNNLRFIFYITKAQRQ